MNVCTCTYFINYNANHCGWHKGDIADIECTWSCKQNTQYNNILVRYNIIYYTVELTLNTTHILRLLWPIRLQHLQDITGHGSLRQHALLLENHRFALLLTENTQSPLIDVWQYMEFMVRAQGDCRADHNAEDVEDLNTSGQNSLNLV